MDKVKYEDGVLKIPTIDGHIKIIPSNDKNYPGVYIDLYSNKTNNNIGYGGEKSTPLALVECNQGKYVTHVWDDGKEEEPGYNINHKIFFKN